MRVSTPDAFLGVLESPLDSGLPILGERLDIRGWVIGSAEVDRVEARCTGCPPAAAMGWGMHRADVAAVFDSLPLAAQSGFAGWLDISALEPGAHELVLTAWSGERVLQRWQRRFLRADAGQAYRDWQRQVDDWCAAWPQPCAAGGSPVATWLVWGDGEMAAAEATAQAWQREGGGAWCAWAMDANTAVDAVLGGPYVGVLRAGDRLRPGAAPMLLAQLAARTAQNAGPDLLYPDHDLADAQGRPAEPVLKPGWNPWLAQHPEVAWRGSLVQRRLLGPSPVQAIRQQCNEGLVGLPLPALAQARTVVHLARPMLTLAAEPARAPRVPCTGSMTSPVAPAASAPPRTVSVVIPSCLADAELLGRCLASIRKTTDAARTEIIVVLNNLRGSSAAAARHWLQAWQVQVLDAGTAAFNWSLLSNAGARMANGEVLLFLNDDVEALRPGWLEAMLALAERAEVGAVGALLRYPGGRIQHGGVHIHLAGTALQCRHAFRHCSGDEPRVRRWLAHDRMHSAVTGACLLTSQHHFDRLGGFDPELAVILNDVDYCLRLRASGLVCAVSAAAELRHHEGWSRGGLAEDADHRRFGARWAGRLPAVDPHCHPSLALDRDDWMFDPGHLPCEACSA